MALPAIPLRRRALAALLAATLGLPALATAQPADGAAPPPEPLTPPAQVLPVEVPADRLDLENAEALRGGWRWPAWPCAPGCAACGHAASAGRCRTQG